MLTHRAREGKKQPERERERGGERKTEREATETEEDKERFSYPHSAVEEREQHSNMSSVPKVGARTSLHTEIEKDRSTVRGGERETEIEERDTWTGGQSREQKGRKEKCVSGCMGKEERERG